MCHHPGWDTVYDDCPDDSGYEYDYDDDPSLSRIALWYDTGKMCGECGAEFTEKNGEPSSCEYCKRRGSELPLTKYPEVSKEAHKAVARRRRKQREQKNARREAASE